MHMLDNEIYLSTKEAVTRSALLSLLVKAPAVALAGPAGVKALKREAVAGQGAALLSSAANKHVTGVDLYPVYLKAQANNKLINSIMHNPSINRRNFVKDRSLDLSVGATPVGTASRAIAAKAPGLLSTIMKTIGSQMM